uniref:Protein NDRG3 n=1 Tax=Romanomermis culicivorax TaxID=13658 RepID=A0A915KF94_ROMCU
MSFDSEEISKHIDAQSPVSPEVFLSKEENGVPNWTEKKVETSKFGRVSVQIAGDRCKPAILTLHDLGLNAAACFANFFQTPDVSSLINRFCVYHVNAPGQEDDALAFSDNFTYPNMDELAGIIDDVVKFFNLKDFIGFGVGAGANVFCRYALQFPDKVNALILINCSASTSGWLEWGYQKANIFYLRKWSTVNTLTVDYLMWHHFGRNLDHFYDKETINGYRQYFSGLPNAKNLAGFIDSYIKRSALNIRRQGPTLKCPVLQIVSAQSPHLNETLGLNQRLDPSKSDWLKISDCGGLILEEAPEKVAEAILLFLQGQGFLPSISHVKWVARRPSIPSSSGAGGGRSMSVCMPPLIKMAVKSRKNVTVNNDETPLAASTGGFDVVKSVNLTLKSIFDADVAPPRHLHWSG